VLPPTAGIARGFRSQASTSLEVKLSTGANRSLTCRLVTCIHNWRLPGAEVQPRAVVVRGLASREWTAGPVDVTASWEAFVLSRVTPPLLGSSPARNQDPAAVPAIVPMGVPPARWVPLSRADTRLFRGRGTESTSLGPDGSYLQTHQGAARVFSSQRPSMVRTQFLGSSRAVEPLLTTCPRRRWSRPLAFVVPSLRPMMLKAARSSGRRPRLSDYGPLPF
jgi:hypothetical protein